MAPATNRRRSVKLAIPRPINARVDGSGVAIGLAGPSVVPEKVPVEVCSVQLMVPKALEPGGSISKKPYGKPWSLESVSVGNLIWNIASVLVNDFKTHAKETSEPGTTEELVTPVIPDKVSKSPEVKVTLLPGTDNS